MAHYVTRLRVVLLLLWAIASSSAQTPSNGAIAGSLLSYDGDLAKADILAYRLQTFSGRIVPHFECAAHIDVGRSFRCEALPPGSYIIVISYSMYGHNIGPERLQSDGSGHSQQLSMDRVLSSYVTKYPIVPEDNLGSALAVNPGETRFVEITLGDVPGVVLKAKPLGPKTESEQISLFMNWGSFRIPANMEPSIDSHGMLVWSGLTPGSYETVEGWTLNERAHQASRTWVVNDSSFAATSWDNNGTIVVTGSITSKGRADIQGAKLMLTSSDGVRTQTFTGVVAVGGTFVIPDVPPGAYVMTFDPNDSLEMDLLTMSGRSLDPSAPVSLGADQSFRIVVRASLRTISGRVNEKVVIPVPLIVISNSRAGVSTTAEIDRDGSFVSKALARGTYRIYCFKDALKAPYADIPYLTSHSAGSVEVNVDNENVQDVIPTCQATEF